MKRKLREIDHRKDKYDVPGVIERLEFDPNRSSNIALVKYADGERRYVLAPRGVKVGTEVNINLYYEQEGAISYGPVELVQDDTGAGPVRDACFKWKTDGLDLDELVFQAGDSLETRPINMGVNYIIKL